MTTGDFDAVLDRARERVAPSDDERDRLENATAVLLDRVENAVESLSVDVDVIQVGSTARDTWLPGDRDIDVFVLFPVDVDRETLETLGLDIGGIVLPDGREEYAEHPYTTGEIKRFSVDLVPAYGVPSASDIRTSVDRTPFHTRYLQDALTPVLSMDVRLFKQFLTAIGAYGSDLKTRGFSGYLAELLVLEYDGFLAVLDAVADWRPQTRLDLENHGTGTFDHPLVVIDPTDPARNVAAVVSPENVARLQHYARVFLDVPDHAFFEPRPPESLSETELRAHLDARETTPIAIRFDAPDIVDDQLYPQLEKTRRGIVAELDRRGFTVMRSDAWAGTTGVVFLELAVSTLPAVERHVGPPVHVREHATGFHDAYRDADVYGPFLDGDRYVVERDREFTTATAFLESDALFDVAHGTRVAAALENRTVLVGDVTALLPEFAEALAQYFSPQP